MLVYSLLKRFKITVCFSETKQLFLNKLELKINFIFWIKFVRQNSEVVVINADWNINNLTMSCQICKMFCQISWVIRICRMWMIYEEYLISLRPCKENEQHHSRINYYPRGEGCKLLSIFCTQFCTPEIRRYKHFQDKTLFKFL